uniref:Enoyl reductase (ER) domain-containing protein n=1 Tax=Timema genevievae TaxID=629358 RepID=A0A7R9JT05_TIMGE|nr:unnamed protein product [Timema genevievae]
MLSCTYEGVGELGHLELSGVTDDGTRFMSVVQNKGDITEESLDPYLTWEIPETWSMEDAATVPLAYATAYHGMIQAAELSSTETVLIHAGHTSIGQAAIALALNKGSTVFTTVAESNHKEFLIKRFPQGLVVLTSSKLVLAHAAPLRRYGHKQGYRTPCTREFVPSVFTRRSAIQFTIQSWILLQQKVSLTLMHAAG